MRTFAIIVGVLAAGPVFAATFLWLGCSATAALGIYCGHNAYLILVVAAIFGWAAAVVAIARLSVRQKQ